MRLSLKVFGFEIASVDLDLGEPEAGQEVVKKASKPVKFMSKLWVSGMTA
ncbi:hypothetical protein CM07_gp42 [Mycobacterium phage Alma]|uniref:Uncharacterized protein n=1 Tax=Mycobacterium phage Alma TaxID=2902800 RepID=G8I7T3_9CAUD|nr:hypothetical protein CM07_gp42 [Mycobacterium phage Alma]AER48772.1 hypothetical protein ALMA_64 [Mycobacterium phage Alma]